MIVIEMKNSQALAISHKEKMLGLLHEGNL